MQSLALGFRMNTGGPEQCKYERMNHFLLRASAPLPCPGSLCLLNAAPPSLRVPCRPGGTSPLGHRTAQLFLSAPVLPGPTGQGRAW